jgi:hypothetical protein
MQNIEEIIRHLAADLKPVSRHAGIRPMADAMLAGGLLALLAIGLWLGVPFQAVAHTGMMAFTVKLSYAAAMTAIAALLLLSAALPGRRIGARLAWLALPPLLVLAMAAMELSWAAPATRSFLLLGTSWGQCLTMILLLSLPVFAALSWALRRLAPTHLLLTGFLSGMTSGAVASLVYALYCPETSAAFMLLWYTLPMLGAGLAGAALSPRLLRW